jgi:hypothetical protein
MNIILLENKKNINTSFDVFKKMVCFMLLLTFLINICYENMIVLRSTTKYLKVIFPLKYIFNV